MATANPYDPKSRIDGLQVLYKVNATGDRWFIPYNDNDTKAAQVAQCDKMAGDTSNGTAVGIESVVS